METKKAIVILAFVAITSVIVTLSVYEYVTVVDVEELEMYLTVGEHVGFNVETSAIFFGTVPRRGSANRDIIISNSNGNPLKVNIKTFGKLSKWVYVSDNNFVLQPKENRTVRVTAVVPEDAKLGNYTGSLKIIFRNL